MRASVAIRILLVLAVFRLAASIVPVRAAEIYSNFGPGNTFGTSAYPISGPDNDIIGPVARAVAITPASDYVLDSVEVPFNNFIDGPRAFDFFVADDQSGSPGDILEQATVSIADRVSIVTAEFLHSTVLIAGQMYWMWINARGVDEGRWRINVTNDRELMAVTFNSGGTWLTITDSNRPTFRLNGTIVPEPSAFLLASFGLSLLGIGRRSCPV
jgi:hypothetical protein